MQIFYKCSFKSSDGYKLACYDYELNELHYIAENNEIYKEKISKTILFTFNYGLGRSMVLASDEMGCCFLGIYGLTDGNNDKHVNAVFADNNTVNIFCLFHLFCIQYNKSNVNLKNTVKRKAPDENGLEFFIVKEETDKLLKAAFKTEIKVAIKDSKNKLFAFITEENYNNYLEKISQNCFLDIKNAVLKGDILYNQECLDIDEKFIEGKKNYLWYFIMGIIFIIIIIMYMYGIL